MSTSLASLVQIRGLAELSPASPLTGAVKGEIVAELRTTNGQGSGQADRAYFASRSLTSGQTHTYNVLAAGSLTDMLGQAVDLDEVKGIVVECLTGAIKVVGGASNGLAAFTGAGDGIALSAGQTIGLEFAAAGVTVGSNGTFEVTETASSTATYKILIIGAN
jgi:hypothetical protein